MERESVRMSVRAVVETTLHASDLTPAASTARRMREGAAAHRARQSGAQALDGAYRAEVALSAEYEAEDLTLRVHGRADGVTLGEGGVAVIEEIKLGAEGMALEAAHMAQAAMYGHMLCLAQGEACVCLRVLYVDALGKRLAVYEETQDAATLRARFDALCAPAAAWEQEKLARRRARDHSLEQLAFPFAQYRAGQRRFAQNAYVAIRDRKRLFAQAPTGIGKTMAALYPALVALREGHCARALFLTARVTGRRSAVDALARLAQSGAQVLAVEIAAKDKVCPQAVRDCRADCCPYAAGFYDRLPAALAEALRCAGVYDRARMAALAKRHGLCPFELSLELARLGDVIVGDYNYVYDPGVAIDALMQGPDGACLLVDEAHQLGGRVRDALSGAVSMDELRAVRRDVSRESGRKTPLYRALTRAIAALKAAAADPAFGTGCLPAPPDAFTRALADVQEAAGAWLAQGEGGAALPAFQLALGYGMAAQRFDARFAALCSGGEKHARVQLLCMDASPEILAVSKRARGTVYFSATLAPFEAARRTLGSEAGDACLMLPSPFDASHLSVRIAPIDIRYAAREATASQVAGEIARHLRDHAGHALVFFPSYAYMERIYELVLGEPGLTDTAFVREARGMTEDEKNALLGAFEGTDVRQAVFAVLGGGFSEGVDLPGAKLQNVIVVSTGLPQPDDAVRAMQRYYDEMGEDGFFMAMTLPGMVRVVQAAGRLIRTETDAGHLLLIDSRFAAPRIQRLMTGTLVGDALGV